MSVKATDFRVGNYYIDEENNLSQMTGYALWQLSIKENLGDFAELDRLFTPVVLTEKILLDFGFQLHKNSGSRYQYRDGYFSYKDFFISADFQPASEDYSRDTMDDIGKKLEYLHQLQNIFYTLNQEELKLKQ